MKAKLFALTVVVALGLAGFIGIACSQNPAATNEQASVAASSLEKEYAALIINGTAGLVANTDLAMEGVGLSVAVGGVGLEELGNGTEMITVDIGGPVLKALLYWAGRDRPCPENGGGDCVISETYLDQAIVFDGNAIIGDVIGAEQNKYTTGFTNNIAYRADVTSIVAAAGTGMQSFSFADGDLGRNFERFNGAGLIVVYTDEASTTTYRLIAADGMDFAYRGDPAEHARVTDPVTFMYDSIADARMADLIIFAGDAVDGREDRIVISDNANIENMLSGMNGPSWNSETFSINIPGGVSATTVELVSPPEFNSSDSLLWTLGAIRIPIDTPECEVDDDCDDDGNVCTNEICNTTTGECETTQIPDCCDEDSDCPDGDVCENISCNIATGECETTQIPDCCVEDSDCEDGDDCTEDLCLPELSCGCCDGKVTTLTLKYLGGSTAFIEVIQKKDNITVFSGDVDPNEEFSFNGAANHGTFDKEIKVFVNGDEHVKIHTSCSKPIGPGLSFGDFLVVSGESLNGGPLCDHCVFGPCECGDKPCSLEMGYTADDCSATSHTQDPDKVQCDDFGPLPATVFIIANSKDQPDEGDVWFSGNVNQGESFVISAANDGKDKLSSKTFVHVFDQEGGTLLQFIEFHTSCSQPLNLDDQFGSVVLQVFTAQGFCDMPSCADGEPEDPGPDLCFNVPIPCCGVEDVCCDGKPCSLEMGYTADDCSATSHTQDPGKVQCDDFGALPATVFIIANEKDQPDEGKIWFSGNVNQGESFVISAANAGENKLKAKTFVHVFDQEGGTLLQFIEFHTSCSQPLNVGNQFGSVVLEDFTSEGNCTD